MKRTLIAALAVLMAAAALPVFAIDFSWNGELTYGVITDFSQVADAYGNAYMTATAKVDDNNSFIATLSSAYAGTPITTLTDLTGTTATINAFSLYLSAAYLTSNIGAILGLDGFNLNAIFGWDDTSATSYSLTGYGYESIIAYDPQGVRDNIQLIGGLEKVVNVQLSFSPMVSQLVPQNFEPQLLADVYGEIGPVNYSVAYTTNKRTDGKGLMGASVKWGQAFGDITPAANAEVSYDLSAPATKSLEYGAAVSFAYKTILTVAAGMNGWTDAGLGNLGINVNVVPITGLGVDLAASLNMSSGATTLINGIDGSVWYLLGKTKLRLGYLYTTIGGGSLNAPATLTNGGLYLSGDLTF